MSWLKRAVTMLSTGARARVCASGVTARTFGALVLNVHSTAAASGLPSTSRRLPSMRARYCVPPGSGPAGRKTRIEVLSHSALPAIGGSKDSG
jgi:hypothetical protein